MNRSVLRLSQRGHERFVWTDASPGWLLGGVAAVPGDSTEGRKVIGNASGLAEDLELLPLDLWSPKFLCIYN